MEYGKTFSRSFNIVWQNKFLILMGILAALAGGSNFTSSWGGDSGNGNAAPFEDEFAVWAAGLIVGVGCLVLIVGIILWAISTIARGGLIASVDDIESGEKSGFRKSWGAGWNKAGALLGIGILPAIPALILFVGGLMAFGAYGGMAALVNEEFADFTGAGLGISIALIACILVPIMLVLGILRNFAERACMLEDMGVIDSYRRGYRVLMDNLGQAIILFLLQLALFIGLGILFFLPGLILVLCCIFWPLLLAVNGFVTAFVSGLWTLAWREWTGVEPPMVEKAPEAV